MQTDTAIRKWTATKNQELHRCGDSLYVRGFTNGRKLFQIRLSINDKRHWIDVGDYPTKSLADAREIGLAVKRVAKARGASLDQIKRAALLAHSVTDFDASLSSALVDTVERTGIPTFDELFRAWYKLQLQANRWTHKSSIAKPIRSYEAHLEEALGNLRVDKITRLDLKNLLQPLYLSNPDLGPALRGFIDEVLEDALDTGLITSNPCPTHKRFAKPQAKVRHAPSLHFEQLPDLWKWIEQAPFSFTVKVAMKTVVVTAHRASVVAYARWEHLDLDTGTWAIPEKPKGVRHVGYMKSGRPFAMQLPSSLLTEFRSLHNLNEAKPFEFVFAMKGGKPLNPETLRRNFKKYGDVSSHGFRNSFKVWALHQEIDPFLVDRYVDHSLQGLDRAYRRDDLYQQRAELAERYFAFVTGVA